MKENQDKVFSGMRPTGKLHLGHLVGALHNWIELQNKYSCVFSIVDWHALMGEYENSSAISQNVFDMAVDWLACGIDPEKSLMFVQSQVQEHLELQMILSCITPLGWLERNPTYKDQLREITTRDLQTYGFLGYPVLQAADILLYKANLVPIGEDQLPHLELTRELSRRFNHIFKNEFFQDCKPLLTETPRLLGLDGRKMSKSYNNAINLSDPSDELKSKIASMITDPNRVRLKDPGNPNNCNVFSYYKVFAAEKTISEVENWCINAEKGCRECKSILADTIDAYICPIREKRISLEKNKDKVFDILESGRKKAKEIAVETITQVKELVFNGV